MFGEGRAEEILVGVVCAVLVGILAGRIRMAMRDGVIPLYKVRKTRAELGAARFNALVGINVLAAILLATIAADLILDLDLRG